MIADPATLAAADRRSIQVARNWRVAEPYRYVDAAFAGIESDEAAVAAVAERLLRDAAWVGALLAPLVDALAADPWFEPPLRVSRDPLRTGAVLYEGPAVSLSAVVLSADALAALPEPVSVVASGRHAIVRYARAGRARLCCWAVGRVDGELAVDAASSAEEIPPLALYDGAVVRQDGRDHAYLLEHPGSDVVTLTAAIRPGAARYAREYRRSDGALLKRAALDDAPARSGMLLTLLRLSGRSDAAAAFDRATRDGAFFLRWQAMREWLALDAAAASPRLAEMALDDPNGEIRAAASATLRLVEQRQADLCLT